MQTVEITAYRIIQESLTNVARHAQSDVVDVSVHVNDDSLYVVISDNGIGFDPGDVMEAHASSGLSGMQERVQLIGGQFAIESAPGQGTSITAIIPLCETPLVES